MQPGHGGFACTACTDLFGLFFLSCQLASARVLVCEMGVSSGCGTLTVTLYVPLSRRVYRTRRESCLRLRARAYIDLAGLAGLWRKQPV